MDELTPEMLRKLNAKFDKASWNAMADADAKAEPLSIFCTRPPRPHRYFTGAWHEVVQTIFEIAVVVIALGWVLRILIDHLSQ